LETPRKELLKQTMWMMRYWGMVKNFLVYGEQKRPLLVEIVWSLLRSRRGTKGNLDLMRPETKVSVCISVSQAQTTFSSSDDKRTCSFSSEQNSDVKAPEEISDNFSDDLGKNSAVEGVNVTVHAPSKKTDFVSENRIRNISVIDLTQDDNMSDDASMAESDPDSDATVDPRETEKDPNENSDSDSNNDNSDCEVIDSPVSGEDEDDCIALITSSSDEY
jgi:hypothetical protein